MNTPVQLTRTLLLAGTLWVAMAPTARAQFVAVGGGVLATKRSTNPVAELHAETPPFGGTRGYVTLSWTDESAKPAIISAAEHPVLTTDRVAVGLGGGLLWLEATGYEPHAALISSTVVPLKIPRTSFVVIASTLPFNDFEWSLVLKVGVTALFVR